MTPPSGTSWRHTSQKGFLPNLHCHLLLHYHQTFHLVFLNRAVLAFKVGQFFVIAIHLACLQDIWHAWLLPTKIRSAQHFDNQVAPTLSQMLTREVEPSLIKAA